MPPSANHDKHDTDTTSVPRDGHDPNEACDARIADGCGSHTVRELLEGRCGSRTVCDPHPSACEAGRRRTLSDVVDPFFVIIVKWRRSRPSWSIRSS